MLLNGKTYSFVGVMNGIALYSERSGSVASSFSNLQAAVTVGSGARGSRMASRSKTAWKLNIPTVAAEATACACPSDVLSAIDVNVEVRADANSTTAQSADALARFRDLVASPQFEASWTQHVIPNS